MVPGDSSGVTVTNDLYIDEVEQGFTYLLIPVAFTIGVAMIALTFFMFRRLYARGQYNTP